MAPGSPELRLNVSFDLDNFKRVALPGLVTAASNFVLPIGVQFNRDDISKEMVRLGRQLGTKKYRVDFEITNLKTALTQVDQLSAKFKELRQQSIAATGGGTIAQSRFKSPKISTSEISAIYRAAGEAGMLSLNESITANKGEMSKELAKVAKDSITGLVNGMVEGKAGVGNAFAELGAEGLKRIKAELGIASPSKRMQQIGKWAGEGYEIGFIGALEEANAKAAATIGKSLRKMDREVDVRQKRARTVSPASADFLPRQRALGAAYGRREQLETAAQIPQLRGAAEAFPEGSAQRLNKLLQSAQLLAAGITPNTPAWARAQSEIAVLNIELAKSGQLAQRIQMQANLAAFSPNSLSYLESQLTLLKLRARDIAPDTDKWRQLNKEIQHTEKNIKKATRKPLTGKERVGAAGGAFLYGGGMGGGFGSAALGIAGGIAGGVPGAFGGAAAGQVVDSALAGAAAMAKQYSQLQKMQRGLAIASIDAKDFAEAQGLVASVSTRLLLPLADASKYYAQLRINTKQYNISAKDTSEILEGTVNAVRATGGSLEDVDGAMRAVVQIFSKGGVQAEELRGQLGERFPGAVIKFVQANKITFEELQKRLEAGTVGIAEFVAFSKSNFTDYAEFSKKLATAPEYAGDRMKIALEQLQITIGSILGGSGATFQDYFTGIIKNVTQFIAENRVSFKQMLEDFAYITTAIGKLFFKLSEVVLKIMAGIAKASQVVVKGVKRALGMKDILEASKDVKEAEERAKEGGLDSRQLSSAKADLIEKRKVFKGLGGQAALDQLNGKQTDLTFGGAGANMPMTREAKDEAAKGAESFAKLQDDLAKTYNDAEIARIKQRHELEKQLRQDYFTMQEYGANRLQKQNLSLLRDLAAADQERKDTIIEAKMELQKQSGKVAGGVNGGGGMAGLTKYITGDPSQKGKGYQADHGGTNYHDHLQFATREAAVAAYDKLTKNGIKVTEFKGFGAGVTGPHSGPGSAHHTGMAFDVGGAQRPVGQEPELSKQVRALIMGGQGGQVSAGSRRVVRGDEKRDVLAQANTGIANRSAKESALVAQEVYASKINIAFAKYSAEVFDTANLELSTQLLAKRNTLIAQGLSPENIDYQMKLYEVGLLSADMERRWDEAKKAGKLSDDEKAAGLKGLADKTKAFTDAQKANNYEVLNGLRIGKLTALDDQLAMAKAFTPDEERRVRIKQENTGQTVEFQNQLFDREKTVEAAQKLKEQLTGIASSIGDAFSSSFKGIIDGSMTAQQALGSFFQNVGNYFVDMAARMIAEWIKVQALKGIQSILSGFNFGGGGGSPLSDLNAPQTINNPLGFTAANGGIATGGFRAFATGGIVTGPTLGLVGEGKYNEAVIPLPDGKSVPVDLSGAPGGGAITSNIVINISSDGQSSSNVNGANSAELGRKIEGAVKQVMVAELRPGGILAGRR
jgi:tape measure domain-containing protein